MSVNGEILGFVHESGLKGSILRSELRNLMRNALPFGAYWSEFEREVREQGDLISLEEVNAAAEGEGFLRALPEPFLGKSRLQNIRLIKVAAYLVANRLLSPPLLRRSLSLFSTYEKLSPSQRFEAKLLPIKQSLSSLSLLLSDKSIHAWLCATSAHRSHELFLAPHEYLFLVSNAADLSQTLRALPQPDSDLKMRGNLFVIDACTKGNQNPIARAQSYVDGGTARVRIVGVGSNRDGETRRRKMCGEHIAKLSGGDIEEFKSLLSDPDLTKRLKDTLESSAPRKAGSSLVAKRYRELTAHHRISHSLVSSPTPTLKRLGKRSIKRH